MRKMALFGCAINEKRCSVDGGRGFALFFVSTRGICHPRKKNANAQGSARRKGGGGWGGWAQLELTDA